MSKDCFTIAGVHIEYLRGGGVRVRQNNGTYRDTNRFHPVNAVGRKQNIVDGHMANGAGMDAVLHTIVIHRDVTDADGRSVVNGKRVMLSRSDCYDFLVNHPDCADVRDILVKHDPRVRDENASELANLRAALAKLSAENARLMGVNDVSDTVYDDADDIADAA